MFHLKSNSLQHHTKANTITLEADNNCMLKEELHKIKYRVFFLSLCNKKRHSEVQRYALLINTWPQYSIVSHENTESN